MARQLEKCVKINYGNNKMSNWKGRWKSYKKVMGKTNKDIAKELGRNVNSIEVSTTREKMPDTFKLAIITCEDMVKNGRIHYKK